MQVVPPPETFPEFHEPPIIVAIQLIMLLAVALVFTASRMWAFKKRYAVGFMNADWLGIAMTELLIRGTKASRSRYLSHVWRIRDECSACLNRRNFQMVRDGTWERDFYATIFDLVAITWRLFLLLGALSVRWLGFRFHARHVANLVTTIALKARIKEFPTGS